VFGKVSPQRDGADNDTGGEGAEADCGEYVAQVLLFVDVLPLLFDRFAWDAVEIFEFASEAVLFYLVPGQDGGTCKGQRTTTDHADDDEFRCPSKAWMGECLRETLFAR